jgi:hypothetical protein
MISPEKLQEMTKEEVIKAHLDLQEYARRNQLYLNLTNENGATSAAMARRHQENATLRQEYTNLQNAHSAVNNDMKNSRRCIRSCKSNDLSANDFWGCGADPSDASLHLCAEFTFAQKERNFQVLLCKTPWGRGPG